MSQGLKVAIVVGEASGDLLGVALMNSLRDLYPDIEFEGIGGPLMNEAGFQSLYPMERLSVMGFIEPLKRLPELLSIKSGLVKHFSKQRPDVFIGIDSPDFNLRVEEPLKSKGIPSVHYVSPSVWAWRQGRIKTIRKAVDMVLCLLPFEADFYRDRQVSVAFVGHPMADEIPLFDMSESDKLLEFERQFREQLDLVGNGSGKDVALLPGSRMGEINRMTPVFLQVADRLIEDNPNHRFLIPAASEKAYQRLAEIVGDRQYVKLYYGHTRAILGISDMALVASGTATLEAMLMKCPMVVAYKVDSMTYQIAKRLVKSKYVSLVNLLAGKTLVKERIQHEAESDILYSDAIGLLNDPHEMQTQLNAFYELHSQIRADASRTAANAVLQLIRKRQKLLS